MSDETEVTPEEKPEVKPEIMHELVMFKQRFINGGYCKPGDIVKDVVHRDAISLINREEAADKGSSEAKAFLDSLK